jgi:predicted phage terminase large subunit-like protein
MENNNLDFEMIRNNRAIRKHMAEQSHYCFFHLYMSQYVQYPTAEFQKELYQLTEDESIRHAVVVAFRGSGKSTIMTVSYPIWAILGRQQKKFVVILSQTQNQARTHLTNIKREFESNEVLRKDYGPLEDESDEWGTAALTLPKFNARIIAASTEQSIRGIRHGANRPDLIIADDVEDMNSVKTRESRNKTYDWFTGEIVPLGDRTTKLITVGNLLHEDSLLMRLRDKIESDEMTGTFRKYPLIAKGSKCLWPGKYPDAVALREQEKIVGNRIAWQREYLLNIIPDADQIIDPKWIKYYDVLPAKDRNNQYLNSFVCVDLAISEKTSADCTAIVVLHVYGYETRNRRYYIDKRYVNKRMSFQQTLETVEGIYHGFNTSGHHNIKLLVEKVAYQDAAIQVFEHNKLSVKGVTPRSDKRSRLATASMLFEGGRVYFPADRSCDPILQQLIGFGVEKHDDLVDAVTMGLNYVNTKVVRNVSMMIADRYGRPELTWYKIEYRD